MALTVPTWAPALGLGSGRDSVWRASRDRDACDDTQTQSAQTDIKDLTQYKCVYRTARLTYSATLITTPAAEPSSRAGASARRAGRAARRRPAGRTACRPGAQLGDRLRLAAARGR